MEMFLDVRWWCQLMLRMLKRQSFTSFVEDALRLLSLEQVGVICESVATRAMTAVAEEAAISSRREGSLTTTMASWCCSIGTEVVVISSTGARTGRAEF